MARSDLLSCIPVNLLCLFVSCLTPIADSSPDVLPFRSAGGREYGQRRELACSTAGSNNVIGVNWGQYYIDDPPPASLVSLLKKWFVPGIHRTIRAMICLPSLLDHPCSDDLPQINHKNFVDIDDGRSQHTDYNVTFQPWWRRVGEDGRPVCDAWQITKRFESAVLMNAYRSWLDEDKNWQHMTIVYILRRW